MDILVAYFSPTGTTAKIAIELANELKADLFQIKPEKPYTSADLKWTNPLARCNREKFFGRGVPCKDKIRNLSDYKVIMIGFPIWYYAEPQIIDTFIDGYDWIGKDIYLFATSGGSGISSAVKNLKERIGQEIVSSKLLNRPSDIVPWLDSLGL